MRALVYLMTVLAVMGLAFWAYRENYRTQAQIDEMQAVQNEIARLRDDLGVLRAEWAYLNRPDRLRALVDMNFDRLRLGPVQATQFGNARNVDYPDPNAVAAGAADAAAGEDLLAPVPSQNRGAPPPRPRRPAVDGAAAAPTADAESAEPESPDAEPMDEAEPPADAAVTTADDPATNPAADPAETEE